jgi:hypothetical protein
MHPNARERFLSAALLLLAGLPAARAETTVIERPGAGTNRIEVTGNRAEGSGSSPCDAQRPRDRGAQRGGPTSNVNSVNISGQSLQGKTIIVTDGRPADCGRRSGRESNVNSVNIR